MNVPEVSMFLNMIDLIKYNLKYCHTLPGFLNIWAELYPR